MVKLEMHFQRWLFSFVCAALLAATVIFGISGRACATGLSRFSPGDGLSWVELYFILAAPYVLSGILVSGIVLYVIFGRIPIESSNRALWRAVSIIASLTLAAFLLSALLTPTNQRCLYP